MNPRTLFRLRRCCLASLILLLIATGNVAADPRTELLWPNGAPGALGDEPKDKPTLTIYLPEASRATGTAVVICPGGGYGFVAMGHEGHDIAQWFGRLGVAGLIVDYRHRAKGYGHPAPLQDAQRAVRTARARANEFGIHPQRIGVMGFSAGGHLASTVATLFDEGRSDADDPIERASSRPDFAILCYPVISFGEPYCHKGSERNLLGDSPDEQLLRSLNTSRRITEKTPPTFLFHTDEDRAVPPENSVDFYVGLRRAGVPAELHIYAVGRHGLGLAPDTPGTSAWPDQLAAWLKGRGLLDRPQ